MTADAANSLAFFVVKAQEIVLGAMRPMADKEAAIEKLARLLCTLPANLALVRSGALDIVQGGAGMSVILKPWPVKYLKQAMADEAALAAIHPKFRHVGGRTSGGMRSAGLARQTLGLQQPSIPQWRRTKEAAGALAIELCLEVRYDTDEGTVTVSAPGQRRGRTESFADHPSQEAAIMAAIVRAAIQIITEARDNA